MLESNGPARQAWSVSVSSRLAQGYSWLWETSVHDPSGEGIPKILKNLVLFHDRYCPEVLFHNVMLKKGKFTVLRVRNEEKIQELITSGSPLLALWWFGSRCSWGCRRVSVTPISPSLCTETLFAGLASWLWHGLTWTSIQYIYIYNLLYSTKCLLT